jgi:replicative DNA helicase
MTPTNTSQPVKIDLDFFETILLYNALTDQQYLSSIISYIDPSFFNDKNIGKVVKQISGFFTERGTVPSIAEIKARLTSEEDRKSLNELKNKLSSIEGPFNKDELIQNTERFLKERHVYKTIVNVAEKFSDQTLNIEEILVDFEKAYNISLKENLGHWYFDDIDSHIKDLTTIYKPIPTGWKFFDEKTEGGLFPKTLTVFAGQVNVGKSIVLGNISTNMLLADQNVLLISLEMSEFMYSKRISTQLTQIPHTDLKMFTEELKEQLDHIKKSISSKLVVKEYPPKTVTVRHIDSFITKLKHKGFNPDIVVIDYINLIHPIAKNLNSYESVKEIAEHLRALAFKHNLPIVSATQLNRGSFNTASPGMEGISESIGLAATCDVICSLWQEEEDRELGIINMGMQKNRFGPNYGSAAFKCNYNTLTLKETNADYFAADGDSTEDTIKNAEEVLNSLSEDE